MSQTTQIERNTTKEQALPRRDLVVLPVIGFLTILLMLAVSEGAARLIWPEQENDPCAVADASGHSRFKANCKSKIKSAEGPWVDNSYNDCGYRSMESCGPKPPGTIRFAAMGSSFSFGYLTNYNETYASVAGEALSRQCRRKVEFQHLGVLGVSLDLVDTYRRTEEALRLKPDVLLLALTPFDVTKEITADRLRDRNLATSQMAPTAPPPVGNWMRNGIMTRIKESRAVLMLQHFMFESPQTFANLYMFYGDNADYLRQPLSDRWQKRYATLDTVLGEMSRKAHDAGVPMVILIGPSTGQASLLNSRARAGVDAKAFDREVSQIAGKYGITVADPIDQFDGRPDVMSLYYPVDGHFNAKGQKLLADVLTRQLLTSGAPGFASCTLQQHN